MQKNLRKRRLLVISDTAIYNEGGTLEGFEPVVRELESIQHLFDEIVWLGSEVKERNTPLRAPNIDHIKMVQMPTVNRHGIVNAIAILFSYPVFLFYILKYLGKATHVHTRAPAHPALLGMLISYIDKKRIYWHKYAGNWKEENLAFTYKLQRSILTKATFNNIRVTVNGKWEGDPEQVYPFENPCIYADEREKAVQRSKQKDFSGKLKLVFVGNVTAQKGIPEILDAVEQQLIPDRIEEIRFVGAGPMLDELKERAAKVTHPKLTILGHLNRKDIDHHYTDCHAIILPSKTEGFPKVIAEAAAYGCIPMVTDVSAISQYVRHGEVGYLMNKKSAEEVGKVCTLLADRNDLSSMSIRAVNMTSSFTYEHFVKRISNEIFAIEDK